MKKSLWKRVLTVVSVASLLMTSPGMAVLADELPTENMAIVDVIADESELPEPDIESVSNHVEEEKIDTGVNSITVGEQADVLSKDVDAEEVENDLSEQQTKDSIEGIRSDEKSVIDDTEPTTAPPDERAVVTFEEISKEGGDQLVGSTSGQCGESATWEFYSSTGTLCIKGNGDMTDYDSEDKVPWKADRGVIKKISIGSEITSIGRNAFYGCSALKEVIFEGASKVKSIGADSFRNCSALEYLYLPQNAVYSKGVAIYIGCNNLKKITGYCGDNCRWEYDRSTETLSIAGSGEMYDYKTRNSASTFSSGNYDHEGFPVYGFTPWYSFIEEIKNVKVLGTINYIGQSAFDSLGAKWKNGYTSIFGAGSIDSIEITPSVKRINYNAFNCSGCKSTVEIPFLSEGDFPNMGNGTLFSSVKLANGFTSVDAEAFYGSETLTEVILPETITQIGEQCFSGTTNLTKINIPSKIEKIGRAAFSGCCGLKSLVLPETLKELGAEAFDGCKYLEKIVFEGVLEELYSRTFKDCTSLKSILFPKNLKKIGPACFSGCESLTNINIPEGVEKIDDSAFSHCKKLQSIYLPSSLSTLSYVNLGKLYIQNTFYDNPALQEFKISEANTSFASYDGCIYNKEMTELLFVPTGKKEVVVPESTSIVGKSAFFNYDGYSGTSIHFRGSLTSSFPDNVFENVNTTAYYPAGNTTWSESNRSRLGGNIVWKEWHPNVSTCTITLSPTSYVYDGTEKKPTVTVKDGTNPLILNTDYTVTYKNNVNAGKATVVVTGKNKYTKTGTVQFTINKANPTLKFANSSVSKKTTDAAFTNALTKKTDGKIEFTSSKESVATVDNSGKVEIKGSGTTTIRATASEGKNYKSGSASYELTVNREYREYTISYNVNGGTGTPSSQIKKENV